MTTSNSATPDPWAPRRAGAEDHPPTATTVAIPPITSLTPVMVEVIVLRAATDGDHPLRYRHRSAALTSAEHPDRLAARLAGLTPTGTTAHILHSTSWRFQPPSGVVLTYLAYPDPNPRLAAIALTDATIARSADARQPSPPDVRIRHVAAHASRHLAFLADTDPAVRAFVHADHQLAHAIQTLAQSLAGQLHPPAKRAHVVRDEARRGRPGTQVAGRPRSATAGAGQADWDGRG